MTARWERLGLVFRAEGQRPWMQSHVQTPHAWAEGEGLVRVVFTSRDADNRSHVGHLLLDLERRAVVELAEAPLLAPGPLGAFDDRGAMSGCAVTHGGRRRFYTVGWNVGGGVPMHTSIGLAEGPAEGPPRIERRLPGPVLDRTPATPFYVSTPHVLADEAGGWRMWMLSGLPWAPPLEVGGTPRSRYAVHHARSTDGIAWTPDPEPCLPLETGEMAIARPCVLRDTDGWRMWMCVRGEAAPYRIAYAHSADGERWIRRPDGPGLPPAGAGFDGDMTCYPFVFDHGGARWMLYCGDGFGAAGMGLARLEA